MSKYVLLILYLVLSSSGAAFVSTLPGKNILLRTANPSDDFLKPVQKTISLSKYGDVQVCSNHLAETADFRIIDAGSPNMQYSIEAPAFFSFYPPKDTKETERTVPVDFADRNGKLLDHRKTTKGFRASSWAFEPLLPESFGENYPELRGPREDHPAVSRHPLFVHSHGFWSAFGQDAAAGGVDKSGIMTAPGFLYDEQESVVDLASGYPRKR